MLAGGGLNYGAPGIGLRRAARLKTSGVKQKAQRVFVSAASVQITAERNGAVIQTANQRKVPARAVSYFCSWYLTGRGFALKGTWDYLDWAAMSRRKQSNPRQFKRHRGASTGHFNSLFYHFFISTASSSLYAWALISSLVLEVCFGVFVFVCVTFAIYRGAWFNEI